MKWMKNIFLSLILAGCSAGEDRTNVELIQDMMNQESIKAQDWDKNQPNRAMMMVPPKGTIPRGRSIYPYDDVSVAEKKLKNPFAGKVTPENIKLAGKKNYKIYCALCHGPQGDGKGPIAKAMPIKPPSLLTKRARAYNDGRLFHIISKGQGVMGSYASQISNHNDRWAIVKYIRSLQKLSEEK